MPIYEYSCEACGHEFETLVLGKTEPASPYGIPGGAIRRRVACSNAYASSISRGSLHAIPAKLTPKGRGFGSNPSGIGGLPANSSRPNGTITVG